MKKRFAASAMILAMSAATVLSPLTAFAEAEEQELNIAIFQGGYGDAYWNQMVELFEESHEGVKVNMTISPTIGDIIRPQIVAGNAPDFICLNDGGEDGVILSLIKDHALLNLDDVFDGENYAGTGTLRDDITDGILSSTKCAPYGDDEIYLAPFNSGPQGLIYNKTFFDENNLEVPKTWARFWDVSKGTIRIGGKDIKDLNPDGLLHYISEVFQENTLLSDTIYNNIKAGRENATEEEIIEAAKAAHCHEFIEKLPEGYQTRLSEGGNTLSGGEKQRIAIARAILKNAPILLLDESTASLDADNEAKINQALDRLMKGKTVFVIAHRLNTIQNADQIILLNQGRIEEMGTHAELLAKKGHYYEMVQEQEKAKKWIVKGA